MDHSVASAFKIRLCHELKKVQKHSKNPNTYLKLVLKAYCDKLPVVQAKSGESGQLTCHAPVTSRSVELDFLVGTENPIRLLYRGELRR